MFELIKNSLRGLFRKTGRTVLTVIGISVGISAVIIISCISQCGTSALFSEIDSLGMGGISVNLKNYAATLSDNELETIQSFSYVKSAMPIVFETTEVYTKGEKSSVYLFGINQNAKDVISLSLVYGRYINAGDISSLSRICMVDQKFAQTNYGTDNIVGRKINILNGGSSQEYKVVGVLKTGGGLLQNMMGTYIPNFIYIPYTTMQINTHTTNYTQIAIKLDDNINSDDAGNNIIKTLERNSGQKGVYNITDLAKQKESINNILNIVTIILSAVGAVSLLVASLSIMNVMLVSVTERTREIGIKKAIGASKKSIVYEFLTEAVMLSVIGCVFGIGFGLLVSWIGASIIGLTLVPRVDIIILTVIFSIMTGIIFGIYPAFKASNLKPVDALRFS